MSRSGRPSRETTRCSRSTRRARSSATSRRSAGGRSSEQEGGGMRYRTLGKTDLEVSELGFGAWGMGGTGWIGPDDDESLRALRLAIDHGVNFLDTAHAYGDGH